MNFYRKGVSAAARVWVNSKFGRYGKMLNLNIDSANKTVCAEVLPIGETAPITVTARYEICRRDGDAGLQLSEISTSKEWINVLLQELKRTEAVIPLPAQYARLLGLML